MADADERAAITRELFALPLDEFTAQRNTRVRELKASGAGALAAEIQQLRRPALPLWAANQLARQSDVLTPVREATAAATEAQARGAATELREALARLQRALDGAAGAAGAILESTGHRATDDTRLRVRELVRLAALRDVDWERLTAGVLTDEPPLVGFGVLPGGTPRPSPAPAPASKGQTEAAHRRAREAHDAALNDARRQAADDAEAAEQAIDHATRLRRRAADLAAEARAADERATAAEDEARRAQDLARKSQDALATLSADGEAPPRI